LIAGGVFGAKERALSDWAGARQLRHAGCISDSEFEVLHAKEFARSKTSRERQLEIAKAQVRSLEQSIAADEFHTGEKIIPAPSSMNQQV